MTILRSRYIIDVPANLDLRIRERNLTFPRQVRSYGNRKTYTWATANVPLVKGEQFAADSNGVRTTIEIGLPMTWNRIAAWYAENARDRYSTTPAVDAKLAEVTRGARSLDDSSARCTAGSRRTCATCPVARHGRVPAAPPADVLPPAMATARTRRRCSSPWPAKMGVRAYPVLLNSRGGVRRELPTIEQLNHAIAAIKPKLRLSVRRSHRQPDPVWTAALRRAGRIRPGGASRRLRRRGYSACQPDSVNGTSMRSFGNALRGWNVQ